MLKNQRALSETIAPLSEMEASQNALIARLTEAGISSKVCFRLTQMMVDSFALVSATHPTNWQGIFPNHEKAAEYLLAQHLWSSTGSQIEEYLTRWDVAVEAFADEIGHMPVRNQLHLEVVGHVLMNSETVDEPESPLLAIMRHLATHES